MVGDHMGIPRTVVFVLSFVPILWSCRDVLSVSRHPTARCSSFCRPRNQLRQHCPDNDRCPKRTTSRFFLLFSPYCLRPLFGHCISTQSSSPPPGRGQLMRPPRLLPTDPQRTKTKTKHYSMTRASTLRPRSWTVLFSLPSPSPPCQRSAALFPPYPVAVMHRISLGICE
jgi:hypothetical protein